MRRLLTPILVLAFGLTLSCGPGTKKEGTTSLAGMPDAVKTYGALRWVPADVSYAFVARRAGDISLLLRALADSAGIAFDADAKVASEWSMMMFGYDLFDPSSLEGIGVDLDRGAAIFGTGLSPTVAAALGEPDRLDAFVERMRQSGVSLQSQMADGVEVFSINMGEGWIVSWAVVDGWVLSRIELLTERAPELGWLAGARGAAGGLGADPDFAAAVDAARTEIPAIAADGNPPIVVVFRPGRLAGAAEAMLQTDEIDVHACLAPLRTVPRVVGAGAVTEAGVTGTLIAELAEPGPLAAMVMPPPAGWATAEAGAALQVDVDVDVMAVLDAMRACQPRDGDNLTTFGVKTAHLAARSFDEDGWPDSAVAYADLSTDRMLRSMLNQIPFLGRMSDKRKVGDVEVIDVSIPMFIDFTYLLTSSRAAVSRGPGMMEMLFGAGEVRAGELFHLELHPQEIPAAAWHLLLERLEVERGSARERTIARIRAWDLGVIDGRLDGNRVVVTATGTRHNF